MMHRGGQPLEHLLRIARVAWYYTRAITHKVFEVDILFLASGVAFNGILTMIPLMLLTASAIGSFLNSSALGVQQLKDVLDAVFPPQPFAISIKESILNAITDIVTYRRSLGIVGVLVLIWTATSLFDALRSVLHRVYDLKRTQNLLVSLMHDVGFVILAFLLFILTNVVVWVFSLMEHLGRTIPVLRSTPLPQYDSTVSTVVVVVLTTFMFYIIYRHMTDSKPPKAAAIISTLTTTTLWVVSGKLFAIYLTSYSSIGAIYGPYAFLLVLLLWIYYSALIVVFGAVVGQVHWERLKLREEHHPPNPS
jgi:membrane protein